MTTELVLADTQQTVAPITVNLPQIVGDFAVPLPTDRDLTFSEVATAYDQMLAWDDHVDIHDAKRRWIVGLIFNSTPKTPGRAQAIIEEMGRFYDQEVRKSWLYECASFHDRFPLPARAMDAVQQMIAEGRYSWTAFRKRYLRPERDIAAREGESLAEQIEPKVHKALRTMQRAEDELQEAMETLPEHSPLRATVEAVLAESVLREQGAVAIAEARLADERGPWRSEEYRAFVRSHGCIVTGDVECEAHHLYEGGMASKTDDTFTVPLSHAAHMELHSMGRAPFEVLYDIDLETVALCLLSKWVSGNNNGPIRL